jgi:wyosine [tRNA(Phe)-imidazoG37] synthetase (radical SAM superfamily)
VTDSNQERAALRAAWTRHERRWRTNLYVYPVVARRSGGISIGMNLNPDKACNFDCVYCQVDRRVAPAVRIVDLDRVRAELNGMLQAVADGSLYDAPPFDCLPPEGRGVRDIALSGDGEPTTCSEFPDAVRIAADARRQFGLEPVKLVLLTNAAYLAAPRVREALRVLDENNGEIWAKLDAGTEAYFRLVNRPNASFRVVLDNILDAARVRPIVIQTLWFAMRGQPPPQAEIEAYCGRLAGLLAAGAGLKRVQVCTIARSPAESFVSALTDAGLDAIAQFVRTRIGVPVEVYYGADGLADVSRRPGM